MNYKGFGGDVQYSVEDGCYYGHILGLIGHCISYEGETLEDLQKDFEAAVDDFLTMFVEDKS